MALSTYNQVFVPPDVDVEFLGFTAPAWRLQQFGWKFREMSLPSSAHRPYGEAAIGMSHPTGMSAMAFCDSRDIQFAVNLSLGLRSEARGIVFQVRKFASRPEDISIHSFAGPQEWRLRAMDMEPYPRSLLSMRRVTLADIYANQRPAEEIIVDPKTVGSLLEEIKALQAPELAAIRERNRRLDATRHLDDQPAPEWREEVSAQIITMRKAA